MAEKRVLARLLKLRVLEEELSRAELEAAVAARNRIEMEMSAAEGRRVRGRRTFADALGDVDTAERTGGVMEMEQAKLLRLRIQPRLKAADTEAVRQREEFLARRTSRRQVETLIDNQRQQAGIEAGRRAQQMLDDWYGRRVKPEISPFGGRAEDAASDPSDLKPRSTKTA